MKGARSAFTASMSGPLQSMQPMPAERQPSAAHCFTPSSLYTSCRAKTGHLAGSPGSERRLRAGSVIIVRTFRSTDCAESRSSMALSYDFDILRPSSPGKVAALVSSSFGSGSTMRPPPSR